MLNNKVMMSSAQWNPYWSQTSRFNVCTARPMTLRHNHFFFSSWSPLCKSLLQTPGRLNWLILDLAPEMHFIHRLRLSENPTPENKQSAKKRKKKQVNVNGLLLYIMNFVFQQFLKQLSFFTTTLEKNDVNAGICCGGFLFVSPWTKTSLQLDFS